MVAGASGTFFAASVEPAMALCKYGTPHCVNPYVGAGELKRPTVKVPEDNGWVDPDCKYYGNCNSSELQARKAGKPKPGVGTIKPPTVVAPTKLPIAPTKIQSFGAGRMPSMGSFRMGRR
jgi:hypothetical protein